MKQKIYFGILVLIGICSAKPNQPNDQPVPTKPTPTENFGNVRELDADGNYWLFWKFNSTHITFETHVKTKGYVGFGLSSNGKMFPADVVVGWVDNNGLTHFKDCHTEGHYSPIVDASQDWFLLKGKEDNSGTVLTFTRKLDTCDDKDYHITESTIKVIYSYHPDDPVSFDSLSWHGTSRRGAKSVMLLSSVKANEYVPPPDGQQFDMLHDNFHVPATDTTYQCKVFKVPDLQQKFHMIRYEPIITPGNEEHVHHILVYNCPKATDADVGRVYDCYGNKPGKLACSDVIIAWAVGGVAYDFPPNVGFSFGTHEDPKYLVMETHFNNPTLKSDIVDSSGFRITATPTIRQHDAGVLQAGAIVNELQFIPPHQKEFLSTHYCSKACLRKALKSSTNTMKVFGVVLHSHLLGAAIKVRHIRGDTEIEPIAEDKTYDFDYQDFRTFPSGREKEIKYGDNLIIECTYDSTGRSKPTLGGLSTSEEMCLAFIYYYPRTPVATCNSEPMYFQVGQDPFKNVKTMYAWDWRDQNVADKFKAVLANSTYYHGCFGETIVTSSDYMQYIYPAEEPVHKYTPPPRQCPAGQ